MFKLYSDSSFSLFLPLFSINKAVLCIGHTAMCYLYTKPNIVKVGVSQQMDTEIENFISYTRELVQRSIQQIILYKSITQRQHEVINLQIQIISLHNDLRDLQDMIIAAYRAKKGDAVLQMMMDQMSFLKDELSKLKENYLLVKQQLTTSQRIVNENQQQLDEDLLASM